jgi:uncharacterized membrane protein YozB (DUF420 family)
MSQGFLGTEAPSVVTRTLLIELAMALALLVGAVLARRRRYRGHAFCQGTVVLLNLAIIIRYMTSSFRRAVVPGIPGDLGDSYYWLATLHGVAGLVAEMLAVYVILVAGTKLLPLRLRFTRFKLWMRTALVLWLVTFLLGVATFVRWYVAAFQS